ncbi:hypothetical protein BDY21DRAFT_218701 [Lineolata rhizophorae]|uniref:Uncharacterized protein n=1 Tax=Lineolata rhizophorae TaxID=578093 RepID=A0A6A6P3I2_9PEZI|nr:hypothetical protein BDY21DRAFT_218701 [Lineolata rhizophorae]
MTEPGKTATVKSCHQPHNLRHDVLARNHRTDNKGPAKLISALPRNMSTYTSKPACDHVNDFRDCNHGAPNALPDIKSPRRKLCPTSTCKMLEGQESDESEDSFADDSITDEVFIQASRNVSPGNSTFNDFRSGGQNTLPLASDVSTKDSQSSSIGKLASQVAESSTESSTESSRDAESLKRSFSEDANLKY